MSNIWLVTPDCKLYHQILMIHDKFKMRLYSLHQGLFTIKALKYVYHEDTGPNCIRRQSWFKANCIS